MPRNIWADSPLPIYPTIFQLENMEDVKEERRKRFEEWSNLPIQGLFNRSAASKRAEHTNKGKSYRGFLDYGQASFESFAQDYTRGIFAQNTANIKYVADRISSIFGEDKYTGTILELDERAQRYLQTGTELSGWNMVDQWSGISHGKEDITDMLASNPPPGWSPKDAVDILLERDPERANFLLRQLGSVDSLYTLTKNARNPAQFFYLLGDAVRKKEIGQSIEDFGERHGTLYWTADWVKNLLVNGVINDPDMVTSTGISLLLGILTGGTSLVASGVYQLTKSINKTRKVLRITRGLQRAQNYLPETVGPHLLRKYLWKEGYARGKGFKGFFVRGLKNIPGNVAEGALTGFMAEVRNQYRKMYMHDQKELDWGRIGWETLFEAIISPAINPVIGWGYKGIGLGGGLPLSLMGHGLRARAKAGGTLAKNILSISKRSKIFLRAETAEGYLKQLEAFDSVRGSLDQLLLEGADSLSFGELLEGESHSLSLAVIFDKMGISPEHSGEILAEILQDITPNEEGYTTEELLGVVVERLIESEHTGTISEDAKDAIIMRVNYSLLIEQIAKESTEEISLEQAADVLADQPELLLPPEIRNMFEETKEDSWSEKTNEEKLSAVSDFFNQHLNEVGDLRHKTIFSWEEILRNIDTATEGVFTGEDTSTTVNEEGDIITSEAAQTGTETAEERTAGALAKITAKKTQLGQEVKELQEEFEQLNDDQDSEKTDLASEVQGKREEIDNLSGLEEQLQISLEEMRSLTSFTTRVEFEMLQNFKTELEAINKKLNEIERPEWKKIEIQHRRLKRILSVLVNRAYDNLQETKSTITLTDKTKKALRRLINFMEDTELDTTRLEKLLDQQSVKADKFNKLVKKTEEDFIQIIEKGLQKEVDPQTGKTYWEAYKELQSKKKKKKNEYQNYASTIRIRQQRVQGRNLKRAQDGIIALGHQQEVRRVLRELEKHFEAVVKERKAAAGPREARPTEAPTSLFNRPDPTIENWNDAAQVIDHKVNEMPVEQAVRSIEKAIATIKEDPTIPEHIKTMLLKKAENKMVGLKKDLKLKQIADKKGRRFFDVKDWLAEDFGESGWGHVVGGDILVSVVVDGDGHLDPAFNVDNQGIFVNRGPGQAARIRLQNKGGMAPLLFGDTELGKLGIEVSQKGEPVIKTKIPLKDALVPDAKLRALDVILNELDAQGRTIDDAIVKKIADNLGISESVVKSRVSPAEATVTEQAEVTFTLDEMMRTRVVTKDGKKITMGGWVAPSSSHSQNYFNITRGLEGEALVKVQNEELTVDKAREMLKDSHDQVIKRSKFETPKNSSDVISILEALRTKGQIPMPTKTRADVLERSTPGIPDRVWSSDIEKLNTWTSALTFLQELYSSDHTIVEDGEYLVAEGQLAEIRHLISALNERGLDWRTLARQAIIGNPSPEEIHMYNLKSVIEIVQREQARSANELKGWVSEALDVLGEEREQHILNNIETLNLVMVKDYLNTLRHSLTPILQINYAVHGFISSVNLITGKITFQGDSHNGLLFKKAVIEAMTTRLNTFLLRFSDTKKLAKLNKLRSRLGLDSVRSHSAVQQTVEEIIENLHVLAPPRESIEWTIENFGNGELDWASPEDVGHGLIDVLSDKELSIQRSLSVVEGQNESFRNEDDAGEGGISLRIATAGIGGLNKASKTPLAKFVEMQNRERFNLRVKEIFNLEMTESVREAFETWINEANTSEGTPNPLGVIFGAGIAPELIGGALDQSIPTLSQLHSLLLDYLFNMPNMGISTIFDQITSSRDADLMFNPQWKHGSTVLTQGDDIDLPIWRWGEAFSIEMMGPALHGLVEEVIDYHNEQYKKWKNDNPDLDTSEIYSDANHVDRNASFRHEWKLASLALVPGAMEKIITQLTEADEVGFTKAIEEHGLLGAVLRETATDAQLEDIYGAGLLNLKTAIETLRTNRSQIANDLGIIGEAMRHLEGITKVEQIKTSKDPVVVALRAVMKVPLMRTGYEAGKENFKKEFFTPQGKGYEAMEQLYEAMDQEFTAPPEPVLKSLENILFNLKITQLGIALSEAYTRAEVSKMNLIEATTGVTKDLRNTVLKLLGVDHRKSLGKVDIAEMTERWSELQATKKAMTPKGDDITITRRNSAGAVMGSETIQRNTEQSESPDPDFTPTIVRLGELKKLWEENMDLAAELTFKRRRKDGTEEGAVDHEAVQREYKERYNKQYKATEEFFAEIERRGNGMLVSEQDIQRLKDIWRPDMPQIQNATFRAMNMLGASGHTFNRKRAAAVAESLALSGVDLDEMMGHLVGHSVYLGVGTSPMSGRLYSAHASKFNITGQAIDRVATVLTGINYAGQKITSYEQYFEIRQGEHENNGDEWNTEAKSKVLEEYLEFKGAEETLGLFDLVDNAYHEMTLEEAEVAIENILYKQIMLWWASYGKLPKSIFPNYTAEDSDVLFNQDFAMKHLESQERMGEELQAEQALEEQLGPKALQLKSKFGLFNKGVAEKLNTAPRVYVNSESEVTHYINNSQQRGILSLSPQYTRSAFTDRGIFALQESVVHHKLKNILGEDFEYGMDEDTSLEDKTIWGWTSAYEGSRFAPPQRRVIDYLARFNETPEENMFAAKTAKDIDNWVQRVYGDNELAELYKHPSELYPYYWLVKKLSEINEEFTRYSKSNPDIDELNIRREQYLERIHLLSKVARNLNNWEHSSIILERPDQPLAITKLIEAGETYADAVTNNRLSPTPIEEEIDFGTVLYEGTVIIKSDDEQAELKELIKQGEKFAEYVRKAPTGTAAKIPQGRDSFAYLPNLLIQDYVSKVLKDFEYEGQKPYKHKEEKWFKDPSRWEKDIALDHRPAIWHQVRKLALSGEQTPISLTFDITKVENQDYSHALSLQQQFPMTVERDGKEIPMQSAHSLSELGFAFKVLIPREYKLIGGKFKLALTPAAVIDMFSIIDNHHVIHSLNMAAAAGKVFGFKRGPEGTRVKADPLQDTVQRAIGYTTETQTNEAFQISRALEMIINVTKTPETKGPQMTTPGPFTNKRSLIDLDAIQRGSNIDLLLPWVEARIAPIKEFISISQRHGLEGFGVLSRLEELITGVTEGDIKSGGVASILTAMIHNTGVLLEASERDSIREINEGQYLWMLDPKIYDVDRTNQKGLQDVGPLIEEAFGLQRQMIVLENRNSIVGNLPFSLAAESMAYDLSMGILPLSEELLMNPEDAFIQRLKKSGEWDGFSIDNPELTRVAYVARTTELLTQLGLAVDATSPEFSDTANWMKDGKLYVLDIESDLQHERVVAIASLDTKTGERSHGVRDKELTKKEALEILRNLEQKINDGYKIVTYNGIGFDLRILGKIAGDMQLASRIAARGVDLMTNIMSWNNRTSSRGLKLEAVSEALGGKGKTEESGALAILLWERSRGVIVSRTHVNERGGFDAQIETINKLTPEKARQRLEEYNNRDIELTADLFKKLQEANSLVIDGESLDVGSLVPAWAEGQNTATWGTNLNRNFRGTEWRTTRDGIESIFGKHALPEDTSGFIRELKILFPDTPESGLKEKLATVALYRSIQSQEARNKISGVYGLSSPHPVQEGAPVPLKHRILEQNYARDTQTMVDFARDQGGLVREDLQAIARQIGLLESSGRVDGQQARFMRIMVLNLYATNPLLIQDTSFDIDARTFEGGKDSHGKYFVRFGPDLRDVSSHQFSALELFAHEITHVARIKFIKDNGAEWNSFKYLMESGSGKSYIKKLVLAWHGGQWTSEARAEYRKYTTNTEEFIAGLGSYHLLQDLLPEISNLTNEEAGAKARSTSIIERMMGFVHGLFLDLSHVWQKITKDRKDVADLMSRLFGLDPLTKLVLPDVGNPHQSYEAMGGGFQPVFHNNEAPSKVDHDEHVEMARKLKELEETEVLSSEQQGEKRFLETKLDIVGPTGLKRKMYYGKYEEYTRKMTSDEGTLDLSRLFIQTGNESEAVLAEKVRWMGQYMLDDLAEKKGNEMQRGAARAARAVASVLSTERIDVRGLAQSGVSGHVGSEFTMGSSLLVARWLTNLIDGNLNVFEGDLMTTSGVHSLTSALKSAALVQSSIVSQQHNLIDIIRGRFSTALHGAGKTRGMRASSKIIADSSWGIWATLVENEGAVIQHTEEAEVILRENYSEEHVLEINQLVSNMAKEMRAFMQNIISDMQELGEWTEVGIHNPLMGYLLSKDIKSADINLRFSERMSNIFIDNVKNEDTHGRIQPHFLLTSKTEEGHYLFPVIDSIENTVEDLLTPEGEPRLPIMFNFLMSEVWKIENREKLSSKERIIGEPIADTFADSKNKFRRTFLQSLRNRETSIRVSLNTAVARINNKMADGVVTWATLAKFGSHVGELNTIKNAYRANLNRVSNMETITQEHNNRLQSLLVMTKEGMRRSERFRSAMAFIPGEGRAPLLLHESLMKGNEYNNALHMMTMNFIQRAYAGHYLARDAWWVPRVGEVISDKHIRKGLALNPDKTLSNLKRGLFDETAEKQILKNQFGIKGTFQDVLTLFSTLAKQGALHDFNGGALSPQKQKDFRSTMKFLQEKYDFLRGFQKNESSYGKMADWAFEMAPGITKLAFAGNLGLASLTVEHITNTLVTIVGEGRFIDGLRTFFTPLTAGLQGEALRLMAEDHLDLIESITQGHLPDYDAIASDHDPAMFSGFVNSAADMALRVPKYVLRQTIAARVMTARKAMYKLAVKNEDKFMGYVAELNDTKPATIKAKKALMNKHNISWMRYGKLLEYYRVAGLLHTSRVNDLVIAMKDSAHKDKVFVLNHLLSQLAIADAGAGGSPHYKNMLDIAGGIKTAETQYIHENMVEPNVFDMYTGTDLRSRAWETFRRFPVLWANQMMFRKGAKSSMTAWAGTAITMLLLDIIYMMLLRLATGTSKEDLFEDLEERGVSGFITTYGTRLPIFGKYYAQMAVAAAALAGGKDAPNGFIPASAAINVVKNMVALGTGWIGEGSLAKQDLVNATRIIPMIGDAFVRLGIYSAWGDMIEKKQHNSGGGSSSGLNLKPQYNFQHMGLPEEFRNSSYESRLGRLFDSFGWEPDWPKYERQFASPLGIPSRRAQRDSRSHVLPAEEQPVPQPSEEPSVPVASSPAPSGQAKSTDLVASIEEQPEKLEMPEGLL